MKICFTKKALKDFAKVKKIKALNKRVEELLEILETNPLQSPPSFEKLNGELQGTYSRRINRQHRLVYSIDEFNGCVTIIRMWTHYE